MSGAIFIQDDLVFMYVLYSKAVSGGQQDFVAIAIAAQAGEQFVGPCGACR